MTKEEDLLPKINGKILIVKEELPLENDPEFLKELKELYDLAESDMRIADLLILATNPNNTRTNTPAIVDDYEEDCPISKETQDRIKGLTHE